MVASTISGVHLAAINDICCDFSGASHVMITSLVLDFIRCSGTILDIDVLMSSWELYVMSRNLGDQRILAMLILSGVLIRRH